ncbi:MAG: GDP-mannose 4,6-dehydratase, partial [Rhodospirillales bacterium]|nr:GDP-mannose 4,6-dehydratase [Rhodospirillales bacterium]
IDADTGQLLINIDRRYYRPTEIFHLRGDASKARKKLGWRPRRTFLELVREMVEADIEALGAGRGPTNDVLL